MAFQAAPTTSVMAYQRAAQALSATPPGTGPNPKTQPISGTLQAAPKPQAVNVGGSTSYPIN